MPFQLIYHAQNDPQWGSDILGFGTTTLLEQGCALTSVAMLLSGYGFHETPHSLNGKLKALKAFAGSGIAWGAVSKLYSQVKCLPPVNCETTPAPMSRINEALARGQPVIVGVDTSPVPEFQSHYVLLYARSGDDYLMLDPWPYRTAESLKQRYCKDGRPVERVIQRVVFYEAPGADGRPIPPETGVSIPPPSPVRERPGRQRPSPSPKPAAGDPTSKLRVTVQKNGLQVYESIKGKGKVLATEKQGTQLLVMDDAKRAAALIGQPGKWLKVKASNDQRGFVDATSVKPV